MNPIYLDYNASTPIDSAGAGRDAALSEGTATATLRAATASASRTGRAIEQARERLALLLGCEASELIFTSGATESNNMVIKGIAKAAGKGKHFITSQIEHPAVLEPCRHLERFGYRVTYLPVDRFGMVDPADLEKAITPDTVLVSIMHSNNEVGTIQDIRELARIASSRGVLFHTDAAQSVGKVRVQVEELGVDFLTVAGPQVLRAEGHRRAVYQERQQAPAACCTGPGMNGACGRGPRIQHSSWASERPP